MLILFELISYFCDFVGKTKCFFSHINEQNDYPKSVQ